MLGKYKLQSLGDIFFIASSFHIMEVLTQSSLECATFKIHAKGLTLHSIHTHVHTHTILLQKKLAPSP